MLQMPQGGLFALRTTSAYWFATFKQCTFKQCPYLYAPKCDKRNHRSGFSHRGVSAEIVSRAFRVRLRRRDIVLGRRTGKIQKPSKYWGRGSPGTQFILSDSKRWRRASDGAAHLDTLITESILARILYIWEFGGGLGHLMTALPLANAYRARGHEVGFAVRDVAATSAVIPAESYSVFQAPVWYPLPNASSRPISYAEILLNHGFGDARKLVSMVRAWIRLFELFRPDLVVLDFSPTAMLAAHIAGVRHCTIGLGFFLPPRLTPVPAFVDGADHARLCRSEATLLESVNVVRTHLGAPPLSCFADFFDTELDLLTTWPEIEHYPQRQGGRYWGPILMRLASKGPDWRVGTAPRVFVYLYGNYSKLDIVLQAIDSSGVDALVYCPGAPDSITCRFGSDHLKISKVMYAFDRVLVDAAALICHGSFGTAWEGLLHGKPMLCLPVHMEQLIATQRLVELGVGIQPGSDMTVESIKDALMRLITQPKYKANAQRIALKYQRHSASDQLDALVDASTKGL
jgi:UDP:flavonoid glycosyltransferase YjiC (YdhE family)